MLNRGCLDGDTTLVLRNAIKVMVVDNKKELLAYVGDFLEWHAFQVTCVDQAGAALRMLIDNKNKYDLLFIDSDLQDVDVITFLRLTKDMQIIPLVMREEEDNEFLLKVITNGAFLVVKRPLTEAVVIHARQYVIKERIKKLEQFRIIDDPKTPKLERESPPTADYEERKSTQLLEKGSDGAKKTSMEWTEDLHSKFLIAIRQLTREGRCFPKDILDAMGVPRLTRMQVASHLQKCRRVGWKFIGNRRTTGSSFLGSCNLSHEEVDSGSYGCIPHNVKKQEKRITFIDDTLSTKVEQKDMDHMNTHSFSGSSSTNTGQVYPVPSTKGSNQDSSPPEKESNEFFYLLKNDDVNTSFSCTTLDLFGPNSTPEHT